MLAWSASPEYVSLPVKLVIGGAGPDLRRGARLAFRSRRWLCLGRRVRLRLVNANFTFGYAVLPNRLPGEGPGALFFKLDITDLFH